MKLEKPPVFKLESKYLEGIWRGDFESYLNKSDEKYYYWDDIKYRNFRRKLESDKNIPHYKV